MTIAVTGANGFVGRAFLQAIENVGEQSRPLVRRPSGLEGEHIVGDLMPDTDWGSALAGCKTVVHLAARVHVMDDRAANPLEEFRSANCAGTLHLANCAVRAGVKRMVFVSSAKVLGETTQPGAPFTTSSQLKPVDAYGISKAEAEAGLLRVAAETGLELVIVRPPLVYGPGVRANFFQMMRWVSNGVPLPFGSVFNLRTLVGVENLASLLLVCCSHPAAAGGIFHAGDGEDVSTTRLLELLAFCMGRRARLVRVPVPVLRSGLGLIGLNTIAQRLCDNLQLECIPGWAKLDWKPSVPLQLGLERTAHHFLNASR